MNTREIGFWIGADDPRISPDHFNEIVATASDIALIISMDGTIQTIIVNPLNQTIGNLGHWVNRNLVDFLAIDSKSRVEDVLREFRTGMIKMTKSVEINHFDNANWDFPIRYTFHLTGQDDSILMLGRDLRPIAELQQRLVRAQLALEKDYESQRDFETRYRVVMEATRDALVMVDTASGKVLDLNTAAARILGGEPDSMLGLHAHALLSAQEGGDVLELLLDAATRDGYELVPMSASDKRPVAVEPTLFRAGSDRTLLCRLTSEQAEQSTSADMSSALTALYRSSSDAIVFCDDRGIVRSVNDAFLGQCNATQIADVKGRSLSEFLGRGNVDLKVLLESASRTGKLRMYATHIVAQRGSKLPVEISATRLGESSKTEFAFTIRDTSNVDVLREPPTGAAGNEEHMRNVVDLVGASPLKDIVSATTDVIEKMCIQAAVEMTGNNRVAAAEMLGLSRQSLYVKLRKYDLIEKS